MEVDTLEQKEDIHLEMDMDMDILDLEDMVDMAIQVTLDTQATLVDSAILDTIQDSFLEIMRLQLMEEGMLLHLCDYMGLQVQRAEKAEDEA